MDLGALLAALALTVVVAAYLARPLLDGRGVRVTSTERRLSALQASREQVLAILLEMDNDYAMGKILPEDYRAERARWVARGVEILKQIDALRAGEPAAAPVPEDLDRHIEAEVARRRRTASVSAASYCGQCGSPVQPGDRFCSRCGAAVATEEVRV